MDSAKTPGFPGDLAPNRRRRSRIASLPTSSLFSQHKKNPPLLGLLPKGIKAAPAPVRNIYTSRAVKEYRQRRALHHKRVNKTEQQKHTTKQEDVAKLKPIDQFRRIVNLVFTLRKAFKTIVLYASEKGKYDQINSETTLSLRSTAGTKPALENLLFDPEEYKRHYQITLPKWAKDLSEKATNMRTDAEVKMLVRLMKQLKGFRRYSPEIQFALCKALQFDSFARSRVVIRKGHVAQRFYFIYSGSVCVTFDDDEHTAFAKPTENAVLNRGDFFGELAFLRNLRRAATIVCLENTELLSVDKEDFFSANIDKCFSRDMEKRVEFLSDHSLFSSWPKPVVRELAEVSRIHEYNSEEVLVRDSTESSWLVLVTKGQCDVLRLLDLSSFPEYVSHCSKYKTALLCDRSPTRCTPYAETWSPKHLPLEAEEEPTDEGMKSSHSEHRIHKHSIPDYLQENQSRLRTKSAAPLTNRVHSMNTARKGSREKRSAVIPENLKQHMEKREHDFSGTADDKMGVGVYMVLDRLRPGMCFGSWSILQHEETKARRANKRHVEKGRRLTLLSGGCEVIKISKEGFLKNADPETIEKLRHMTRDYPNDAKLCHTYLKHSDWRTYREELVDNLVVRHSTRQEAAKGSWRTSALRASPVPSPLCSLKLWQPVHSTWERFPRTGLVHSEIVEPIIEAGPHKSPRHSVATPVTPITVTTPRTSVQYSRARPAPITKHQPPGPQGSRPVSTITRPPTSFGAALHQRKILPVVHNELVLAQGSHRALVLTHGGAKCNEVQREVERRILGLSDLTTRSPTALYSALC